MYFGCNIISQIFVVKTQIIIIVFKNYWMNEMFYESVLYDFEHQHIFPQTFLLN